jgi:hypothetical protein
MLKLIICLLLVGYVNSLTFDKNVDLENPNVNKIVFNNDILYVYDKLTIKILSLKNINCYGYICNNKFKQVICYKNTISNFWKCGDNNFNIKLNCTNDCKLYSYNIIHPIDYLKSNKSLKITDNILLYVYLFYFILIFMIIILYLAFFLKYLMNIILDCDVDVHFDDIYTRRKPSKKCII